MKARTLRFVLMAGFLFSCNSYFVEEAKYGLLDQDYDYAIEMADEALIDNPTNSEAYLLKIIALSEKAGLAPVLDRKPIYDRMVATIDSARKKALLRESKDQIAKIDREHRLAWLREFNAGNKHMNANTREEWVSATNHFENAHHLSPDSVSTLIALSRLHRKFADYEKSKEYLQQAWSQDAERTAPFVLEYVEILQHLEQWKTGLDSLNSAPDSVQNDNSVLAARYNSYLALGMYNQADFIFPKVAEANPSDIKIRWAVANREGSALVDTLGAYLDVRHAKPLKDSLFTDFVRYRLPKRLKSIEFNYVEVTRKTNLAQAHIDAGTFYFNFAKQMNVFCQRVDCRLLSMEQVVPGYFQKSAASLEQSLGLLKENEEDRRQEEQKIWGMLYEAYTFQNQIQKAKQALRNLSAFRK